MRPWREPAGRPDRPEEGAVVIVVALVSTLLLTMAALVVDVGAMLDEKRQLQNGADAAAFSLARQCALEVVTCGPAPGTGPVVTMAKNFADLNAGDAVSNIDSVTFPTANQVRVATSTRAKDGSGILPYAFGQVVTGQQGSTVHASATASWTGIGRATTIPLAISLCEWNLATLLGTVFNTTLTGPVSVMLFHTGGSTGPTAGDCAASSGQDSDGDGRLPGGFGWLDPDAACRLTLNVGDLAGEKPGTAVPTGCNFNSLVGTNVLVPIFDDVNGLGGNNGVYRILGFGELRLTGFRFPGVTAGVTPCLPPGSCVGGYFTRFVALDQVGGGPDLGALTVSLVH